MLDFLYFIKFLKEAQMDGKLFLGYRMFLKKMLSLLTKKILLDTFSQAYDFFKSTSLITG